MRTAKIGNRRGVRMAKRSDEPHARFEVLIEKLVYGGAGLAHHQGKVVFVPFTAPGDRVLVRTVEEKRHYIRACAETLIQAGPGRVQPECSHFQRCGGCQWQHLDYSQQLEFKREILRELLQHHFPETKDVPVEMRPSPQPYGYRSRARLQLRGAGDGSKTGFFRHQSHEIEQIEYCPLLRPVLNAALKTVSQAYRTTEASLPGREIQLAGSEQTQRWAACASEQEDEPFVAEMNPGAGPLKYTVGRYTYFVAPSAFFQANDFMTPDLVSAVLECCRGLERNSALELYCGVGLFTLPLAERFESVTAIENSAEACHLCVANAQAAGMDNIRIMHADVAQWLEAVAAAAVPAFDLVLLDPPRAGAGPDVISRIREWAPSAVIYVSCDPQTLMRDLAGLVGKDYRIAAARGLDLFPQTYHFETVVLLLRR